MSPRSPGRAAALLLLTAALLACDDRPADDQATTPAAPNAAPEETLAPSTTEELVEVELFFPGEDGRLHGERRQIPAYDEPEARIASVIEQVLAGPQSFDLEPPLPDTVALTKAYLLTDGTAAVDLASAEGESPPASGSRREMLMVYSLVNSVLRNVEEARQVVLLWNGRQPVTFAGHLSTVQALRENSDLIAEGP